MSCQGRPRHGARSAGLGGATSSSVPGMVLEPGVAQAGTQTRMGVLSRARLAAWLLVCTVCTGCGLRQLAVGQMVPILENATEGARERTDLQLVAQGLPANLLLLDGLIRTSPKNVDLLTLANRSDDDLAESLHGSAMRRTKVHGLRRNIDIALANVRDVETPATRRR